MILTSLYCWWPSSFSSSLIIVLKVNTNSDPEVHFQQDLCSHSTSVFNYFVVNRTTVYSLPSLLCLRDLWCLSSLGLSPLVQFPALQNIWEVARWCSMQYSSLKHKFWRGQALFKLEDPEFHVDYSILWRSSTCNLKPFTTRLFGPRGTFLICLDYTEVWNNCIRSLSAW